MSFNNGTTFTVSGGDAVITGEADVSFSGILKLTSGNLVIGTDISTIDNGQVSGSGTLNLTSGTINLSTAATTFQIGSNGATGTFNQSGGSIVLVNSLQVGALGGRGIYTISGTGADRVTLTAGGQFLMNNGTFTQDNTNSVVDLSNATGVSVIGNVSGSTATYNLDAGTLLMHDGSLGGAAGGTGNLDQSGGTFTSTGTFFVGSASGSGFYNLSGGTADFQSGFTIRGNGGSAFNQSGSSVMTAEGAVTIGEGVGNAGTYNLSGGTATFNAGLVLGASGSVLQTGGNLVIPGVETLDLSTAGGSYTLAGGTLQVANGGLAGVSGQGTLNFGGGTLQITSAGAYVDPLDGTLTGISTIDAATTAGITTVALTGNLSGAGGITFDGSAGTNFSFGGTNTYTGTTAITTGILNATSANIVNSSALVVGTAGVLNLTVPNAGFAYPGSLGGAGTFNAIFTAAATPLVIRDASSFTGGINLNGTGGTLQLYSGTNVGDINGAGSAVTIGGAALTAFPMGFTTPSSGVVTIANANYTGLTTVNSGFTFNVTGASGMAGDLSNLGGTVNVTGAGGIAGTVQANSGALTTSFVGGALNNNVGGTFIATSALNAVTVGGTVTNDGALISTTPLSLTAPSATFTAGGALNQSATGSLNVRIAGGATDEYVAGAASTVAGSVRVSGFGTVNDKVIIDSPAGLNTAGLTVSAAGAGALFTVTIQQVGNTEELSTTQNPTALFALTSNQRAVAGAFDPVLTSSTPPAAIGQLATALNGLTADQVPGALDQLSPESLQYARGIARENASFLVQRIDNVLSSLRAGYLGLNSSGLSVVDPIFSSGLGRSMQSMLAYDAPYHPAAPNGVNYYPGGASSTPSEEAAPTPSPQPVWDSSSQVISDSPTAAVAPDAPPSSLKTPALSEFVSGDAVLATLNKDAGTDNAAEGKATYTAGDATAGVSFRMTSNLAMGVLFNYNHTDAKTDSFGSKIKEDSYSPGIYGTFFDKGFYVNGLFAFGYNTYTNTRNIPVAAEQARSSPDGQQYTGNLDLGYDFHPDPAWVAGPIIGGTYTHLDVDSFTESGADGANLAVQSQNYDSFRTRLGGHVEYATNLGDVVLAPNLNVMWQHEFLNDNSGITSTFSDLGSAPFTINTANTGKDSALIGVGLTATLNTSVSVYLNYLADVGATDYFAQSIIAGLKARF